MRQPKASSASRRPSPGQGDPAGSAAGNAASSASGTGAPRGVFSSAPLPGAAVPYERLVIGLLFAIPVLLFVWPVLPRFCSAILGMNDDNVLNLWTFWHASNAVLLRDEPLYSTMRVLAPVGSTLALHDICLLPAAILAPATAILGAFAGFNLLLVMAQLWAGLGAFTLVRYLTRSRLSGAFAAFLIESSPILYYRMINHYSLTYIGFIPVLIYLVLRAADTSDPMPARRLGVTTGLTAIACFLTSFNIFILSFFTLGGIWAAFMAAALAVKSRAGAKRLAVVAGWTGLVCVAFFFVWAVASPVQDARFWWVGEPTVRVGNEHGALPAYFVTPNPRFWLFASGPAGFPSVADGNDNPERFTYLGLLSLALFAIGMRALFQRRRAAAIVLLLATFVCFNMSLGYGSVNPMALADADQRVNPLLLFPKFLNLPLMKQARVPARWAFPLLALIVAGAGCGAHWLLERSRRPAWRFGVLGVLCAVATLESIHKPTPTTAFEMPEAYQAIGVAKQPTEMLVEWPIFLFCGMKGPMGYNYDPARMIWSMRHRYRIVTGYLSRVPVEKLKAVVNQPLLRDLWMLQGGAPQLLTDEKPTDLASIKRWVALNDARYVIVNKKANYQLAIDYLTSNKIASPVKEDAQYVVLQVER